ncbi:MAG: HPr family phosphocarrier protein [Gammaproteobacteria bacterium]|nr:HPr family phosphocarrier protein [Gammaproteobacteria bacterium]
MASRELTIVNKLGLHARAAAKLVNLASGFESDITIRRGDQEVNAKSIMGVMMLAAAKGVVIEVSADGGDADDAIAEIAQLVQNRFGEPE